MTYEELEKALGIPEDIQSLKSLLEDLNTKLLGLRKEILKEE